MIHFRCPHCEAPHQVHDRAANTGIRCQDCYQSIQVPEVHRRGEFGRLEVLVRVARSAPDGVRPTAALADQQ